MSDDLVERVARRLCNTAGSNWNAENFNQTDDGSDPEDQREYYRFLARAAIAVVLEEAAKVAGKWQQMYFEDEKVHVSNITEYIVADILALVKEPA